MKIALIFLIATVSAFAQTTQRTIAITIDDLPVVSTRRDLKNRQEITRKLLGHIKKAKIPAIGFVNENKLYANEKRDEAQVDLLRMWTDAGLELGNHTYSHRSLNAIPLAEYQSDLLKGESITRELLAQKKRELRFFRHPYLQTGRSMDVKAQFEAFLKQHGYTIAPVSIDNADYIFSRRLRQGIRQGRSGVDEKGRRGLCAVHGGEGRILGAAVDKTVRPRDKPNLADARELYQLRLHG